MGSILRGRGRAPVNQTSMEAYPTEFGLNEFSPNGGVSRHLSIKSEWKLATVLGLNTFSPFTGKNPRYIIYPGFFLPLFGAVVALGSTKI